MYAIGQYVIVDDPKQDVNEIQGMVINNNMTGDNYSVRLSDGSQKVLVVSEKNIKRIASRQEIIENNQIVIAK